MKRLLIVILCVLCLMSCERNKIKRTLKTFYKSEIMIPDDLTCIYKRAIRTASADSFATCKFIVYYDTLDCSSCRVAHLNDFAPMYELAEDDDRFDMLIVFSPRADEIEDLKVELMRANYDFPIYIDEFGSFAAQNTCIPAELLYHNFLINKKGNPIFVGLPTSDENFREVFYNVLDNN